MTMAFFASAGPAWAVIPLSWPHLAERVALADAVVVAKVDELKEDLVYAFPILKIPGAKKMSFQIADLSVRGVIAGPKEWWASKTRPTLQAGYIVARARNGEDLSRFRRLATVKLAAGEEGCFFLRRHPEEPFWVLQNAYDVIDKAKAKDYDKDIALVKGCAGLLKDTKAGLQAKEKEDRLLTAAMLISRYRIPQYIYTGKPKTMAIDAEESRRILAILLEGDWSEERASDQLAPLALFLRLDLTEEDGWSPPKDPKEYASAAQRWLRENSGQYRIQRYVAEK
jgi:hypothetical protein